MEETASLLKKNSNAAKQLQLALTPDARSQLMQAYKQLKAWPDVRPTLSALKAAGLRLAFLSNMTAAMLHAGAEFINHMCVRSGPHAIGLFPVPIR